MSQRKLKDYSLEVTRQLVDYMRKEDVIQDHIERKTKLKATHYTIVKRPDNVTFTCPHCDWEHDLQFETIIELAGDEYNAWTNPDIVFICENNECQTAFRLNEVDVD